MNALLRLNWLPAVTVIGYALALVYFLAKERLDLFYLCLAAIPALVFLKIVLFRKVWLAYALLIATPLSIAMQLGGGFAASFPSEPLLAFIAGIFLLRIALKPTVYRQVLFHPITLFLMVDTGWLIITSISSTNWEISLKRVLMRFLFITVCYLLFSTWFRKRENISRAMLLYVVGLLPVILITLDKHAMWDFITSVSFSIPQPYFADHTIYGACIAFVLPFLIILFFRFKDFRLPQWQRVIVGIVLAIFIVGEIFAYSRAAWLSLFAAGIFAVFLHYRVRLRMILGAAVLIGGIVFLNGEKIYESVRQNEAVSNQGDIGSHLQSVTNLSTDASNLERINRWMCAWMMFQDKPLLGFGPGTYQYEYGKYQTSTMRTYISTNHGNRGNAHSEYLTYLSESGLPGLISFLCLVICTVGTGMRIIYRSKERIIRLIATGLLLGLTTFFVHGLFNSFIDQDKMAVLVFMSMAGLVALEAFHMNKESTEPSNNP